MPLKQVQTTTDEMMIVTSPEQDVSSYSSAMPFPTANWNSVNDSLSLKMFMM